jgi:hypothetical protein
MDLEDAAELGVAQDPQEAYVAGDEPEPSAPGHDPVLRPAQHTQPGTVDERQGAQVQYEIGAWVGGQRVQTCRQRLCREEVDLAAQLDDGRPGDHTFRGVQGGGGVDLGHGASQPVRRSRGEGPIGPVQLFYLGRSAQLAAAGSQRPRPAGR